MENVDRLLRSPAPQRGRDFGIILRCLNDLGYAVEWRVINAAEYGFAQRRRRVFIFAFKKTTNFYKKLSKIYTGNANESSLHDYLYSDSFFAKPFKLNKNFMLKYKPTFIDIDSNKYLDLIDVSNTFKAPLYNAGVMIKGNIYSVQTQPVDIPPTTLKEIRHKSPVDKKYFLNDNLDKWKYLKGAKRIDRIRPNGEPYVFSEGNMCFPDNLDLPARTMLTSESSVNRSSHVIFDNITYKLRTLTPVECEKLNGFDENWTDTGMPEKFRYFCMGNALVVPLVTKMGNRLIEILE